MTKDIAHQQLDLTPKTLDEAVKFADIVSQSDFIPKDFQRKPGNILVAIQWGMELGLKPMQAMQNIAVINGRPSLWGDAVIALARSSPLCEYIYETDDGNTATCKVKRRGENEQVRTFGMEDAKAAGLSGKSGPWSQYPKRMRQMRARAFALRDVFPDILKGIPIAEEVMDYQEIDVTPGANKQPESIPEYPEAAFLKNLPKWEQAIKTGATTHQQWIDTLSQKGQLTQSQLDRINEVKAPIEGEVVEQ